MSDTVDNAPEPHLEGQTQVDYKTEWETIKTELDSKNQEFENLKRMQSASDSKVTELQQQLKQLENLQLSEKEREQKLQQEKDEELEQLRVEKKRYENKTMILEKLSDLNLPSELVNVMNLDSDENSILTGVSIMEKVVTSIKEQAIEEYKNKHRPGYKPSGVFNKKGELSVDDLMVMARENPAAYNALPDDVKKPVKKQPKFFAQN